MFRIKSQTSVVLLHTTGHQPTIVFCLQFMGVLVSESVCRTHVRNHCHSLRSLDVHFLVPQMASDCLCLLLGFIVLLHSPSCQYLMLLNETGVVFVARMCDMVLGVKVASGLLWVGDTVNCIISLVLWRFSAFSLHCLR